MSAAAGTVRSRPRAAGPHGGAALVRILLVNDHDIVREGLAAMLEREPGFLVAGAAASSDVVRTPAALEADVIVLDDQVEGGAPALCREIAERRLPARVVVLASFPDDAAVREAFLAGATALVLKDVDPGQLKAAIRLAAEGRRALDPQAADRISPWSLYGPGSSALPPAHARVLRLLCRGRSNQQIAEETGLSASTVSAYLVQIYRALGVSGRAAAAAIARRKGLA